MYHIDVDFVAENNGVARALMMLAQLPLLHGDDTLVSADFILNGPGGGNPNLAIVVNRREAVETIGEWYVGGMKDIARLGAIADFWDANVRGE